MYKTASRVWQKIRKSAGRITNKPTKKSKDEKEREKEEKAKERNYFRELISCDICEVKTRRSRLTQHIYKVHKLAACKYCESNIELNKYNLHLREVHNIKRSFKKKKLLKKTETVYTSPPSTSALD